MHSGVDGGLIRVWYDIVCYVSLHTSMWDANLKWLQLTYSELSSVAQVEALYAFKTSLSEVLLCFINSYTHTYNLITSKQLPLSLPIWHTTVSCRTICCLLTVPRHRALAICCCWHLINVPYVCVGLYLCVCTCKCECGSSTSAARGQAFLTRS